MLLGAVRGRKWMNCPSRQDLSIPAVKIIVKDAEVREGVPLTLVSDARSDAKHETAAWKTIVVFPHSEFAKQQKQE